MNDREFSFILNLYKAMVPGVTSKTVGAATRNFKALCGSWNVDVNHEQMSRVPNLLIGSQNANSTSANSRNAAAQRAEEPGVSADDGGAFSDSGGPVAQ